MKRFVTFVLLSTLLFAPVANGAPKKITVKPMQLLASVGTPTEVSGAVVSGKTIIIFGTKSAQAYVKGLDSAGKEIWNLSLDKSVASIATAAAVDPTGDIWIVGATPLVKGDVTPTAKPTPLNPDNAVVPSSIYISDLHAISIWKVSAAGVLLATTALPTSNPILPTAIAVDKNGASIVGIVGNDKGNVGFFVNADSTGIFSTVLQIGTKSTTATAVVRHSDGTFTVTGSSSETLAGKKVVGISDGVLVKVSKTLKITAVVRSSIAQGERSWGSASPSLLLGGEVLVKGKSESAVTKFSTNFAPIWTYRFAASGPTFTASSTQALFLSTGAIPQLNWNPKSPTPLLLTFDTKGIISAADSAPIGQKEVLGLLISKELGVLTLTSSAESVSIFTLLPR